MTDDHAELLRVQAQWEALAGEDPLWGVLTDPAKEHGKWDSTQFFSTGKREVDVVLGRLRELGCHPDLSGEALDFGCGVGRLTGALAARFATAHGVDISSRMIDQARVMASAAQYHHNASPDLRLFEDGRFAFIYSNITLQHCPPQAARAYIAEFVRLLASGGICVMQIPEQRRPDPPKVVLARQLSTIRGNLAVRTRLRALIQGNDLEGRPSTAPRMDMNAIPQSDVDEIVRESGGEVIDVIWTNSADPSFSGELRYFANAPTHGWSSCQYSITRR